MEAEPNVRARMAGHGSAIGRGSGARGETRERVSVDPQKQPRHMTLSSREQGKSSPVFLGGQTQFSPRLIYYHNYGHHDKTHQHPPACTRLPTPLRGNRGGYEDALEEETRGRSEGKTETRRLSPPRCIPPNSHRVRGGVARKGAP